MQQFWMKNLYGSPMPFKVGANADKVVFYFLLRRQDFNGFNVLSIRNANNTIQYVQIRMLGNFIYQVFDPTMNKTIGKISMYDDCLVRVYLECTYENPHQMLKVNIGFFNLQGTAVADFATMFRLVEGAQTTIHENGSIKALVVPQLVDFNQFEDEPLIYLSTFVEQETAEPAPTPGNENNTDLVFAPDDSDLKSEGEPETDNLFDYVASV